MTDPSPGLDLRTGTQRTFLHVLLSTLVVSVINFTVWFAVTFWVYLETRSVFATGLIAGIFLVSIAVTGVWFGSLVDHHHKKTVMQWSAAVSLLLYAGCLAIYLVTPDAVFRDPGSVRLWVFVVLLMTGVVAGNLRTIATPTLVTLLIPEDRRDKANGLVGSASGVSFLVTSVISGLLVAAGGMLYVLLLAMAVLALAILHLGTVQIPETRPVRLERGEEGAGVDLRGTVTLVRGVPGLVALIAFSCFNNFLGGAFMALMDAYGLSLVSVQAWGLLWGVLSAFVIAGGLVVARVGLGSNPVRALLLVNVVLWSVTALFPIRSSIVLLAAGMAVFMLLIPFAEAAADGAAEGRAVRAPGPGLRVRPERGAGRLSPDRLPDRPDRAVHRDPVHDRRLGCGDVGPLVRHRRGPRPGPDLRGDRDPRPGGHPAGAAQPVLPAPVARLRGAFRRALSPGGGDVARR